MKLLAKSTGGEEVSIMASPQMTALQLRTILADKASIPLDQAYICYNLETLDDALTLEDYGIQEGSTIYIAVKRTTGEPMIVQTEDGQVMSLTYSASDTVQKMKRQIGERAYGKRCPLKLFILDQEMEDSKKVKDYHILDSTVVLAIQKVAAAKT